MKNGRGMAREHMTEDGLYTSPLTGDKVKLDTFYYHQKKVIAKARKAELEENGVDKIIEYAPQPVLVIDKQLADTLNNIAYEEKRSQVAKQQAARRFLVDNRLVSKTTEWRHRKKMKEPTITVINKKDIRRKEIEEKMEGLDYADKLALSYKDLVKRIAVESHDDFIQNVNFADPGSITIRNAKLQNVKQMIAIARGLRELVDLLRKDYASLGSIEVDEQLAAQEKLIEDAEQLLKR
jgi:hypothetical protein